MSRCPSPSSLYRPVAQAKFGDNPLAYFPAIIVVMAQAQLDHQPDKAHLRLACHLTPVCIENLIRVDDVVESLKLAK
jgi:hypothetical protein